MSDAWETARSAYWACVNAADLRASAAVVREAMSTGSSATDVIEQVLRPAQNRVGDEWHANRLTVADEHAASAIAEAALMTAAEESSAPVTRDDVVVLVCAEGDWHTLPLRMVAEELREQGFACILLGPSLPPAHLTAYLERVRPAVLGVGCSLPIHLDGLAACAAAAHAAGVPVLAGGRGTGDTAHRATVAGCDGWAPSGVAAGAMVERLRAGADGPGLASAATDDAAPPLTAAAIEGVSDSVIADLTGVFPQLAAYTDVQWQRTREDVAYIIRFAEAAIRYRDLSIFVGFHAWLASLLAQRHVPAAVLARSLSAIAGALPAAAAATRDVVSARV